MHPPNWMYGAKQLILFLFCLVGMRRFVGWQKHLEGCYKRKRVATKLDSSSMHKKMMKSTPIRLVLAQRPLVTPKTGTPKSGNLQTKPKEALARWLCMILLSTIVYIVLLFQAAKTRSQATTCAIATHMESITPLAAWSGERMTPSIGALGSRVPTPWRTSKDCQIMSWERRYITSFGGLAILVTREVSELSYRIVEKWRCDKFFLKKMERTWGSWPSRRIANRQ